VKQKDTNNLYCRVHLYESNLTNVDIANLIKSNPDIDLDLPQVWDSAEPKSVVELRMNDINAHKAIKGAHSIYFGIQKMQQYNIYVYNDALGMKLMAELEGMRFLTDANGEIMKDSKQKPRLKPGKDHCVDPVRYILTKFRD